MLVVKSVALGSRLRKKESYEEKKRSCSTARLSTEKEVYGLSSTAGPNPIESSHHCDRLSNSEVKVGTNTAIIILIN